MNRLALCGQNPGYRGNHQLAGARAGVYAATGALA
jgi:hypothetical protein